MKLSITNCPSKDRFLPLVEDAVRFFADKLLSKQMQRHIFIKLRFDRTIDAQGYTNALGLEGARRARIFLIEIHPGIGAKEILKTIAHEMVHVKQFAYGDVNKALTRFKGESVVSDDYWTEPWEVEAYGLQAGLFQKFAIHKKLWEIVDGVEDPSTQIKNIRIGLKR